MTLNRSLLAAALVAAAASSLSGCLPMVATGIGAGTLMIVDRRTSGAYVEDEAIEWKTRSRIGDHFGSRVNVNPTSYNRNLLLTGEVPDNAAKAEVERLATGVPNVRAVTNEVQVAGISSLASRGNDAYLTSKIKARFVEANRFSANHIKVVTEAGTVYLMGMVTRGEADAATDIARTTGGVLKVVRLFEYVSDEQARQLDNRPPEATRTAAPK